VKSSDDQIVKILERFPNIEPDVDFSFANDDDSVDYLHENLKHCDKKKGSIH
jgi:hypothetical protein